MLDKILPTNDLVNYKTGEVRIIHYRKWYWSSKSHLEKVHLFGFCIAFVYPAGEEYLQAQQKKQQEQQQKPQLIFSIKI